MEIRPAEIHFSNQVPISESKTEEMKESEDDSKAKKKNENKQILRTKKKYKHAISL